MTGRRKTKRPIYTLDCETDPFKAGRVPEPFLWGLYESDSTTYRTFATAADVAEYLCEREALVYAHNGGRFDFHYMLPYVAPDEPMMVINGRLARFRIGKCEFRDSMTILNEPLRRFAKETVDYSIFEPGARDIPANRVVIENYLRSDCVNLYNVVAAFESEYGRHLTQAGAAMRYWSRTFDVKPPKQTVAQFERYKPYYYGGRAQSFVSGHVAEDFSVVDINSAYPFAMLEKHPFTNDAEVVTELPKGAKLGPSLCRIRAVARGCLPFRVPGGLEFPNDDVEREYCVTGWEIIAGLETGTLEIRSVIECHVFNTLISFRDYIEHFFDKRKEAKAKGDKFRDLFAKRMMNALYGKMAADPRKYTEHVLASPENLAVWASRGFERMVDWPRGTYMERPLPEEKRRFYNVATAASITGYVRAHLWRAIRASTRPLYCDTDSIAAVDVSRLPIGPELGQWKVEMQCDEYAIAGKKQYAFHARNAPRDDDSEDDEKKERNWKKASKGTRIPVADIIKLATGEKVRYDPTVPTYSLHKPVPQFVARALRNTHKGDYLGAVA